MITEHISPYSGAWYPGARPELDALLDGAFERSAARLPCCLPGGLGFVVPHAGPSYSGTVAASAYRAVASAGADRVAVLAFPHHGRLEGVVAPGVDSIATPLGTVPIERGFAGFREAPEERVCDHSFEIQLPFLQRAAPGAKIAPLYVGRMSAEDEVQAAQALADAWRPGTVFVASSDFTHYGRGFGFTPFPPDDEVRDRLRDLDFECIEAAATLSAARFRETLRDNGATVCGYAPIGLLLETLRRIDANLYQTTLDYETSGDITGDFQRCVSYAALGWFPSNSFALTPEDRDALLNSVVETLSRLRAAGKARAVPAAGGSPALQTRRGVFVSLHRGDELLGCMGTVEGSHALADEAAELALAAALRDPRFQPALSTTGPVDVEISTLTPLRRIAGAADCRPGVHGVFLRLEGRSALLLPQVAAERGWDAEQFLDALARKAALGPGAWRDPRASIYVFEADVFARGKAVE